MSLFEELKELGVDVDEGLERVMEDESLYEMTLSMFIDSVNNNPIRPEDFDAYSLFILETEFFAPAIRCMDGDFIRVCTKSGPFITK